MASDWQAAIERAEALLQAGDLAGAESAFAAISANCPRSDVVARAEQGLGEAVYRDDGRERESLEHFRRAVRLAGKTQTGALAWLSIADVHRVFREFEETLAAYESSAAIFKRLEDFYGEFLAEDGLQECLRSLGRAEEAAPHLARAGECAFLAGELDVGNDRLHELGELALSLGRPRDALAAFTMAADVAEKRGDLRREMKARLRILMQSDDPEVLSRLPEMSEKLSALEDAEALADAVALLRGAAPPGAGGEHETKARATDRGVSNGRRLLREGVFLAQDGEPDRALELLLEAENEFERAGEGALAVMARAAALDALGSMDDQPRALAIADRQIAAIVVSQPPAFSGIEPQTWRSWELAARDWRIRLRQLEGATLDASEFQEALTLAEELGEPGVEAGLRLLYAVSLSPGRRFRQAIPQFERAAQLFADQEEWASAAVAYRQAGLLQGKLRPENGDPDVASQAELAKARNFDAAASAWERADEPELSARCWYFAGMCYVYAAYVPGDATLWEEALMRFERAVAAHRQAGRRLDAAFCGIQAALALERLGRLEAAQRVARWAARDFHQARRPRQLIDARLVAASFQCRLDGKPPERRLPGGKSGWHLSFHRALVSLDRAWPDLDATERKSVLASNHLYLRYLLTKALSSRGSGETASAYQLENVWDVEQLTKARDFGDHLAVAALAGDPELVEMRAELVDVQARLDSIGEALLAQQSDHERAGLRRQRVDLEGRSDHLTRTLATRFKAARSGDPTLAAIAIPARVAPETLGASLLPGEAYLGLLWDGGSVVRILVVAGRKPEIRLFDLAGKDPVRFSRWLDGWREAMSRPDRGPGPNGIVDPLVADLAANVHTLVVCPDGPLAGLPWHALRLSDGQALGDRWTVSLIPSAATFVQARSRPSPPEPVRPYLGIGCNTTGEIPAVDVEVQHVADRYFGGTTFFTTADAGRLFSESGSVGLLHVACHASGTVLGLPAGKETLPHQLAGIKLRAQILLLTGCELGRIRREEGNEFPGVVRELLIATGARAAVVSAAKVRDDVGMLFADQVVAALTGQRERALVPALPAPPVNLAAAVSAARTSLRHVEPAALTRVWRRLDEGGEAVGTEIAQRLGHVGDADWSLPWYVIGDPNARLSFAAAGSG